jgi:hypothetical protein
MEKVIHVKENFLGVKEKVIHVKESFLDVMEIIIQVKENFPGMRKSFRDMMEYLNKRYQNLPAPYMAALLFGNLFFGIYFIGFPDTRFFLL